ncbi:MAG TPA: hypothetical protein PKE52_02100 [Bacteroidales bacterium]|jgi:cytochrome c-type biogenesis protein CcmH/NrfG|nr:hypothetical protein [Bacteroidales bacterium]
MRLIFVKTNKNKKFEYKPRFYDPKKEEMERLMQEGQSNSEEAFREKLKEGWRKRSKDPLRKKSKRISIMIYLLLIAILLFIIFF